MSSTAAPSMPGSTTPRGAWPTERSISSHFAPWEEHARTTAFKEFSRACDEDDIPYYPIPLVNEQDQLQRYLNLVRRESGVTFVGRHGTYRYLDMDVTIKEALEVADCFLGQ